MLSKQNPHPVCTWFIAVKYIDATSDNAFFCYSFFFLIFHIHIDGTQKRFYLRTVYFSCFWALIRFCHRFVLEPVYIEYSPHMVIRVNANCSWNNIPTFSWVVIFYLLMLFNFWFHDETSYFIYHHLYTT